MKIRHVLVATGLVAAAFFIGRVTAEPASTPAPLVFHGALEDDGVPSTAASAVIALSIWKDATSTDPAQRLCEVRPTSPTPLDHGHFELTLGADCVLAVRTAASAVYVQVEVGGLPLGRAIIGSVPSAERASVAASVDWSGVSGVTLATAWPGTVAAARVDGWESLAARVTALESRLSSGNAYNVAGRYCGETAGAAGGAPGGHAQAKTACESTCGKPTAHVCTSEELIRGFALDRGSHTGWYASGAVGPATVDCDGFSNSNGANFGASWSGNHQLHTSCSTVLPILCCN